MRSTLQNQEPQQVPPPKAAKKKANGAAPPASEALTHAEEDLRQSESLRRMEETAKQLLQPAPSALTETGHQTVIPLVNTPQQLQRFRTHPTMRLTLAMACPGKGNLGAHNYAIMPSVQAHLARENIKSFTATLFPIMLATRPITYALVLVKMPPGGKRWDNWSLTKKLVLDEAVEGWRSMRQAPGGGYCAHPPNPGWAAPAHAEFPDYSEAEWLHLSLGVTDLIVHDDTHSMFQEISG